MRVLKGLKVLLPVALAVQFGFSYTVYGPVRSGTSLWNIAASHSVKGVSVNTMINAIVRLNPQAFAGDKASDLRAGAKLYIPTTREEVDRALSGKVSSSELKSARPSTVTPAQKKSAKSSGGASGSNMNSSSAGMNGSTQNGSMSQNSSMNQNSGMSQNSMMGSGASMNGGSSATTNATTANAMAMSMNTGGTAGSASTGANANTAGLPAPTMSMGSDTDQVSASSQVQTVANATPSVTSDAAAMPMSTDVTTLQQQLTQANTQIQSLTQKLAQMSANPATGENAGSHQFWTWFWFVLFVLSAGGLFFVWSKRNKEGDGMSNFFDRMTGSEKKNSER